MSAAPARPETPRLPPPKDAAQARARSRRQRRRPEAPVLEDFQPHALAIQDQPPPRFARILLWSFAGLLVAAVVWSYFGKLPIMTTAPGKFTSETHVKVIQSLNSGTVSAILVRPGEQVHKGQVLMRLDPNVDAANLASQTRQLALDALVVRRLRAELDDSGHQSLPIGATPSMTVLERRLERTSIARERATLVEDRAKMRAAQANLEASVATLRGYVKRSAIATRLAKAARPLVAEGALSGSHYDQLEEQAVQDVGEAAAQRKQVLQLQQTLAGAREQLAKDRQDYAEKNYQSLEAAANTRFGLESKQAQAQRQYRLDWLRAPVDGTVQSVDVASLGTVIQPGQTLATVVPQGSPLVVEVDVPAQEIGFLHIGQPTRIKVTAYPFEQYGDIPGKVVWISPTAETSNSLQAPPLGENRAGDAGQSSSPAGTSGTSQNQAVAPPTLYYRIKIRPTRAWLSMNRQKLPMRSGMTATVDIQTGERRVIGFFLDPIVKYLNQGLAVR